MLVRAFRDIVIMSSIPGPGSEDLDSVERERSIIEQYHLRTNSDNNKDGDNNPSVNND